VVPFRVHAAPTLLWDLRWFCFAWWFFLMMLACGQVCLPARRMQAQSKNVCINY
jgi:hypothetical protein